MEIEEEVNGRFCGGIDVEGGVELFGGLVFCDRKKVLSL